MKIAAVKILQRKVNGSIIEIVSVPEFDIPEEFIQSLFNIHLAESNGKPNFKKIEGETTIFSFFSGDKEVFMVEPNFDLIIIPEDKGEDKEYLRVSRILLNNFLVHLGDSNFKSYIQNTINKINSEGPANLKIEKKEIKAVPLNPEPKIETTPPQINQKSDNFSDINDLVKEIQPESDANLVGAANVPDPFGGAANVPDPFGGAASVPDPFGGAASVPDPFGGAASVPDPFGGAAGEPTSPSIPVEFKSIDPKEIFKSGEEDIAFSENPWAQEEGTKKEKKENKEPDPFSENPFG
jgi:hypothetical protein